MTFDIKKYRAMESAPIELVDGEANPIYNEQGDPMSVTVFGPGSKIWQQAEAEMRRRKVSRIDKARGKLTAAVDNDREDEIEFLVRITVSLNGWTYPHPEGGQWPAAAEMYRALYSDDEVGFIRDHLYREARDWGNFTKASAKN